MKFYTYAQNNSGGYFVENEEYGICEYVIIEAENADESWEKLERIGEKVEGMWHSCYCCGERWSSPWSEEGDKEPKIWEKPVLEVEKDMFTERAFIHYANGEIKQIKFK